MIGFEAKGDFTVDAVYWQAAFGIAHARGLAGQQLNTFIDRIDTPDVELSALYCLDHVLAQH